MDIVLLTGIACGSIWFDARWRLRCILFGSVLSDSRLYLKRYGIYLHSDEESQGPLNTI